MISIAEQLSRYLGNNADVYGYYSDFEPYNEYIIDPKNNKVTRYLRVLFDKLEDYTNLFDTIEIEIKSGIRTDDVAEAIFSYMVPPKSRISCGTRAICLRS